MLNTYQMGLNKNNVIHKENRMRFLLPKVETYRSK